MILKSVEYKYLVAGVFISGLFMQIMDTTVINVALPQLGRHFAADNDSLQWVVVGYLVSLAVWIPASGWVGDRFGTKRTFLFAMAVFTTGSALCGVSQNIGQLIAFRVLQGVGGGMMVPVGTAMLFRVFPPRERARAAVFLTIPSAIAPVVGPILGGWLVDGPGWRWIFYINLPVGIMAFLFALKVLQEHKEEAAGLLDLPGFILSGGGLALVLYALSQGPSVGWGSAIVLATGLAGILCLAAMALIELRVPKPMLDLRLIGDRMFRNGSLAMFLASGGLLGLIFLLALFLQQVRGFSAFQTGFTIFPLAIGMGLTAQLTSRIYSRVGPRRMIVFGMLIITLTSAVFLRVDEDTSLWWIRGIMFVRGVGLSFTMVSLQAATFATITPPSMGRASSLFATNRQVAAAVGVAALATVLIERTASRLGDLGPAAGAEAMAQARLLGFQDAFLALTVMGALGLASAFLIRDKDAEATLEARGASMGQAASPANRGGQGAHSPQGQYVPGEVK